MSMITGCPACGTMFRVVSDQLKISEGWVRCGHCGEVFDATAHLQDEAALAVAAGGSSALSALGSGSTPPADSSGLGAEPETAVAAPIAAAVPAELATRDAEPPVPDAFFGPPARHEAPSNASVQDDLPPHARPSNDEEEPPPLEQGYLPAGALRREDTRRPDPLAGEEPLDRDDEAEDAAGVPVEDLGFVRQARRKAFWRRPAVRAVLLVLVLVLAALLALQMAIHDRDRLAAAHPELRPWLERLCEPLACRLQPPRRIDAIAIDSSAFARLRADAFRLSFTLKNQSRQPVAVPALELTLTDAQEQPVVRRVLQPRELGAPGDTLPPAGEWSAGVSLALDPAAGNARVAGYRLLAFYP